MELPVEIVLTQLSEFHFAVRMVTGVRLCSTMNVLMVDKVLL